MSQDAVRLILSSVYIYMTLQHDMVLRKCSCLIGAKNVHCAKVLYGIQVLNDGFLPWHHHRSLWKVGGYYHWKHLGRKTHSHGYGKDEGIHPVAFGDAIHKKHDWNHYQHKAYEQQAHLGNALVESRSCTMSSHALGYCTKIGMVARRKDYALGRTTYHIRAHKADVVQVNNTARVLALSWQIGIFLNRIRLTRQARLAYKQVFRLYDAYVGRYHVACREHDNIAWHKFLIAYLIARWTATTCSSCSNHITSICHHHLQCLTRTVGFPLLAEAKYGTKDYHGRNDDDWSPILVGRISHPHIHDKRDSHQHGEHTHKGIDERLGKHHQRTLLLFVLNLVLSIKRLTLLNLFVDES